MPHSFMSMLFSWGQVWVLMSLYSVYVCRMLSTVWRLKWNLPSEIRAAFSLCRLVCTLQYSVWSQKTVVCCALFGFVVEVLGYPLPVLCLTTLLWSTLMMIIYALVTFCIRFLFTWFHTFVSCFISSNTTVCTNAGYPWWKSLWLGTRWNQTK